MNTKVLSYDAPSAVELAHGALLDAWVQACLEPEEESSRRRTAVEQLLSICRSWIRYVMVTVFGLPATEEYGGRIFATGSYRHNVHASGSDIDLVLIAPDRITREHFFSSLVDKLRERRDVTDLTFTEEAVVPIISFKMNGIDIDLSFVSIRSSHVPDTLNFLDNSIHIGLDEFAVRSVNGVRDAQLLLDLVPNTAVFRAALRFVKRWSKQRAIYGAKLGFTSGIGWAILVARVCQLYPNQNAAGILLRFFKFCRTWFKPGVPNSPVYITPDLTPPNPIPGVPRSWHPHNGRAEASAMFPVITPAYPYQNSCYSVSRTTLDNMLTEFNEAYNFLVARMEPTAAEAETLAKKAVERLRHAANTPNTPPVVVGDGLTFGIWSALLEPYNVFEHHQHFLHVGVSCASAAEYDAWADFVESKIRFLWFEGSVNRGNAFECYPAVKLRVCSCRFEDPAQQEELRALKTAAKAAAAQARTGVPPPSPPRQRTTSSSTVFTAHYYFGFSLAAATANGGGGRPTAQNVADIRAAFHTLCRSKMSEHTSRLLPTVEIVALKDLPKWLPGLPTTTITAPSTTTTTDPAPPPPNHDTNGGGGPKVSVSDRAPPPPQAAVVVAASPPVKPRPVSSPAQQPARAQPAPVFSAPPHVPTADADELLGLDF